MRSLFTNLFASYLVSSFGLIAIDSQSVSAQVVPDQSTATEVNGNAIAPVGAGTVSGGNLYHSFDQFNVPQSGVTFSTGSSTVDGAKVENILNRVTGDNPSQILGTIESRTAFPNANLFLMNPNGVVFGKDARLDIGGSFNVNTGTGLGFAGDRTFSVDQASLEFPSGNPQNIKFGIAQPAAIINQGNLTVDAGKNITFTAGAIVNSGILTAPSGNVAITSVGGGSVVDLRSPDLVLGLSVAKDAVPTDWNGEIATLPKLAELLTGKAEQGDRVVVNPDGTFAIVATPTNNQLPVTNGTTVISGTINVSSTTSQGGNIGIFGDRVALINSQITSNSGNVLIGGDLQGNGVVPNAQFTYFDQKSIVDVSALANGNGGKAIVWGDRTTQFFGTIFSKGGAISGDGGFVEVSGKDNLVYRGNVDTSAVNGKFGTLLLDPTDITITAFFDEFNTDQQLNPNFPNAGDPAFTIFFNDVITSNFRIQNTTLNAASSNIILQARNNININAPLNIANPNISFTAQAGNNINVNQNITTNRGNISLLANNGATATGTGSIQSTTGVNSFITTNGGNFTARGFNFGNVTTINTTSSTGGGNIDIDVTGAINANQSTFLSGVSSFGTGNAGNITLRALGSIQASALQAADGVGANVINGGNVTLNAGGNITIGTLGSIATRSTSGGKAGEVLLISGGSITALGTTGINASVIGTSIGGSQAGNITFQAGATINTDAAIASSINSNTVIGNAGNISFTAGGNISATGDLITANLGTGNAGKIDIISSSRITTGNIVASSFTTAGNVTLTAFNNITTGYILGLAGTQGSNISLIATNGNITIPATAVIPSTLFGVSLSPCGGSAICTSSLLGGSGNITLNAGGTISTINISGQLLTASLGNGKSGNISFTSGGDLTTGFLITGGLLATGTGGTGDVSLTSVSGNITTTDIIAPISAVNSTGNAGNITISAFGDVNLISADTSITETTATGNAGKISITSQNGLIAASGNISSGVLRGSGNGNDLILSARGNVSAVNVGAGTVFGNGNGGNIQITGDSIDLTTVGSPALLGASGNVKLDAVNNITAGLILNLGNTKGGDVSITSTSGTIQIPNTIPSSVPQALGANLAPCVGSSICTAAKNGTAGNITIAGNLSLSNATKFLSTGTVAGGIINLENVNIDGTQNLTIDAGTGAVKLSNIGATTNLGTLTINAGSILANQAIAANNISFTTTGNLSVNQIQTNLATDSGDIILNSGGTLSLNGDLDTSSTTGTSGFISLTAVGDIFANGGTTFDGRVLGGRDSKPITVTSQTGNITGSGLLDIITSAKNAGAVTLEAANSIVFRDIKTDGSSGVGGNVTVTATNGNITGNTILATSQNVSTGSGIVSLTAKGDIEIFSIDTNTQNGRAGDITVQTDPSRTINGLKDIQANSITGQGGNITLVGNLLPNAGFNILAGGAIAGSTIDLRTASLLIGGNLIIDSVNSDILLGLATAQPFNFEIRNARNVTLNQNIDAQKVDITNTGILRFEDIAINTPIFQQQNASEVQLAGDIIASTITFNSPVVLTGNTILTASDFGVTQGTIAFNSTLNGGGRDLKLSTNEIDFGNNVSGINALTLAPDSSGVNIQLGGATNVAGTFTLTETDLINVQAGGLGSLIIGGDFGAEISIVSPIPTFLQKTTFQADGFGNIDSLPTISQGRITALAPIIANGSDTITFIASQNVTIGDVTNTGKDIIVTSTNANVVTGKLDTSNISVSQSGNVIVNANKGSVSVDSIVTRSSNDAGNVSIQALDTIQTTGSTNINGTNYAIAAFSGSRNGGTVSLTSTNGSIDTQSGTVATSAFFPGAGGNITFTSNLGAIATGDLSSSGYARGGNIDIIALTQISTGQINSSSSVGTGGNVTLDPIGDVIFTSINATGSTNGGNINIVSTGGNVLGRGIIPTTFGSCVGATICTNGTGTVSIQHGITSPFDLNAFLVGSATTNGTFGTINVGGLVIGAIAIPNPAGSFVQGNLTVSPGGIATPPIPPTPPTPPIPPTPQPPIIRVPIIEIFREPPTPTGSTSNEAPRDSSRPTVNTSDVDRDRAGRALEVGDFSGAFDAIENAYISAYENYLGETLTPQSKNIEQLQQELEDVSKLSGSVSTAVYPIIMRDRLELLIIPPKGMGKPFREFVAEAKESEIIPVIQDFANNIRDTGSGDYMEQSQKLYNWLVRPYRDRLQALQEQYQKSDLQVSQQNNIQANAKQTAPKNDPQIQLPPTLVFVMDGGLRIIPVSALHDGEKYLIEEYALANLPYLRATRLEKRDRNLNNILAMGLTESVQGFSALPGVRIEVSTISSQVLKGNSYLDQEFTVDNLQEKRRQGNYGVLHLATHAQFLSDDSQGAFIQFWNERLSIDRIPKLRFDNPLIEMLTLSACQTAVGQNLGLGGLAVSSGAKSVLASLWEVSDTGTAPLMIQFYNSFPENITKAIALQRSQIEMIRGGITIKDGKIIGIPNLPPVPLAQQTEDVLIQHPYFWSSFILIGNWL